MKRKKNKIYSSKYKKKTILLIPPLMVSEMFIDENYQTSFPNLKEKKDK